MTKVGRPITRKTKWKSRTIVSTIPELETQQRLTDTGQFIFTERSTLARDVKTIGGEFREAQILLTL